MEVSGSDSAVSGTAPDSIRLRSYQAEMVEESLKQNIIVAMDTGSGKTHIAISRTAAELESCEPHKFVWFLAPTVTLCHQQSCLFEKYLPAYQLLLLSGADNVERWTDQTIWNAVLKNVRIVISTPQVLLDALTHAFVDITSISLLIFDEAHHCRGNHPTNAILMRFYRPLLQSGRSAALPKILGLTASPVLNAKAHSLEIIEQSLNAITKTPKLHRTELLQFTHRPELIPLPYGVNSLEAVAGPPIYAQLGFAYHALNILEDPYVVSLRKRISDGSDAGALEELQKVLTSRKTFVHNQIRKLYTRASDIHMELGGSATEFYIRSCIKKAEDYLDNTRQAMPRWSDSEAQYLRGFLSRVLAVSSTSQDNPLDENFSPKMQSLIDLLLFEARSDFTGIIFVEQRATVAVMSHLLSSHPKIQAQFNIGTFVGTSISSYRRNQLGISDLVQLKYQQQTLDDFRTGRKNLMIATNVLEEGIDVSNCHIVICFEPPRNLKSFIQRRGRARKQDSKFIIMFPKDSALANSPEKWLDLEEQMKETYLNDLRQVQAAEERESIEEEGDLEMRVESTGALLTLDNAVQHLYHFCAILGGGQHIDLRPRYSFTEDSDGFISSIVTLPNSVAAALRQHSCGQAWRTEKQARKDASFQAYKALHQAGLVNNHLLPLLKDAEHEPEFGVIEDKPSMVEVSERMDPWVTVARAVQQLSASDPWFGIKVSLFLEGQEPLNLLLLLPIPVPAVSDIILHWNRSTQYIAQSEAVGEILLAPEEVRSLQKYTRTLLASIYSSRIEKERQDFLALFASYPGMVSTADGDALFFGNKRPATEVYHELQNGNKPSFGLVRRQEIVLSAYMFQGFHLSYDDLEDGTPQLQIRVTRFPKRRDFLHPITDVPHDDMYTTAQLLPAKECLIDCMPTAYSVFAAFIPSILHCYELSMITGHLCNTVLAPVELLDHDLILQAITASSTNESDYQRLEFLGDTILKFSTTVQLMAQHLSWPESYLTKRKDRIVSNGALAKAARRASLDKFIRTKAFTGSKWRPRYVEDILADAGKENQRLMSTKTLADVVESLIGASYVEGGIAKAGRCITALVQNVPWRPMSESRAILREANSENASVSLHLEQLETLIGYRFNNKMLLLEAMTHPSFSSYRETASSSYQRLEFLGDAILDYLIVRRLYAHSPPLPHYTIHGIRTALVNASFLAFVCMELTIPEPRIIVSIDPATNTPVTHENSVPKALWQFMRHTSPTLVAAQQAAQTRHRELRDQVLSALQSGAKYPWNLLARTAADKFFSDIIEAVLGAIFIDSPTGGNEENMAACEAFLARLGILDVLERVLRDGVKCLHPMQQLGMLALSEKVKWEWDTTPTAPTAPAPGADASGTDADADTGGGADATGAAGEGAGLVRCRVVLGDRRIGGWVDGITRLDAKTEATERAITILLAERAEVRVEAQGEGQEIEEVKGVEGAAESGDGDTEGEEDDVGEEIGYDGVVVEGVEYA